MSHTLVPITITIENSFERFCTQEVFSVFFAVAVSKAVAKIWICQHSLLIFPWMKFYPLNIHPTKIHSLVHSPRIKCHIFKVFMQLPLRNRGSKKVAEGQLKMASVVLDRALVWKCTRRSPGGGDILRLIILFLHLKCKACTRATYLHVKPVHIKNGQIKNAKYSSWLTYVRIQTMMRKI